MKEGRETAGRIAAGSAVTVLTCLALLFAASVMTAKGIIEESEAKPCIIAACAMGSALGSAAAARGKKAGRSTAAAGQGTACAAAALTAGALIADGKGMEGFAAAVLCTLMIPALSIALMTRKRRRKHR
ncbi:MAG: hypothetical protein K5855_02405 [Oscillospiraceae bacterium]|jgi:hypothetical protein|nr:hypothetical protein [Oscillospiraceae bacterium]